jgi:hypothetical protein
MPRYQFLNIETGHLIIADPREAALQLALNEAAVIDAREMSTLVRLRRYLSRIGSMRFATS